MKIAVFGLMKRSHYFQGLKMFFCCCLEEKETLFLRVFWEKANKNVLEFFGLKSWVTPLKNCDFWPYEKIPFLRSKNVSFLFKTWRNSFFKGILRKRKKKNVLEFFCPKSRVTPLKNCDFWRYEKIPFLWSKNVSVLFRRWRNSIFKGILRKSKKKNVLEYFCPKSWVTPLENCDFWPYEKIPFLRSKMVSVLCRT